MQNTNEKIKNEIGWVILLGLLGCYFALYLQGCSGVIATTEGIKALNDGANGLVRSAKETPQDDSKYFGHRESQIANRSKLGFFQKLMN